jgi:hypothetical protein
MPFSAWCVKDSIGKPFRKCGGAIAAPAVHNDDFWAGHALAQVR